MLQRTAKSCGPDAPTLASSLRSRVGPTGLRQDLSAGDGGKTARSPGRARRKPLKPLRAGTPGDSGVLVVTRVRSTTTKCTRGRGCNGHPAFPTPSKGRKIYQRLGRIARRGRKRVSATNDCCLKIESMVIIAATDEATQTPSFRGDAKHRTRNLEIPRCAIAHLRSGPADHPGMTVSGLLRGACHRARISRAPLARNDGRKTGALNLQPSQLPRITERERRHPPGVLIQNQRPRDRWLGALAAVFAFAEPAVDADRRALGLLEVHPGGIDQPRRVADLAAEPDGKARLRLRVRRHRPAHH